MTEGCAQMFGEEMPAASHLLDSKLAAEGERRAQIVTLEKKISALQEALDQAQGVAPEGDGGISQEESAVPQGNESADKPTKEEGAPEIVLHLPKERRGTVHAEVIDGKRCIVIPLEDGETAKVNGDTLPLSEENESETL